MTKIYVHLLPDENNIKSILNGFYHNTRCKNVPSDAIEITEEQYTQFWYADSQEQKSFWQDSNGNIQIRDRLSKWDKKKKTFIIDQEAVDAEKILINKAHARLLIDKYIKNTMPYYFNKYTKQQQIELNNYLDALHNEKLTELPLKPEFLG